MPKYVYQCLECEQTFEVTHSFEERFDTCSQINEHSQCTASAKLERIPQHINFVKKKEKKMQVGQIVDDFIKNTKEEIKEYKKEMINWSPKK